MYAHYCFRPYLEYNLILLFATCKSSYDNLDKNFKILFEIEDDIKVSLQQVMQAHHGTCIYTWHDILNACTKLSRCIGLCCHGLKGNGS